VRIKQFEIWIADLNPQLGTEPGKTRPILVVQTDLLNNVLHPSSLVCPITSNVYPESEILRVHLPKSATNLKLSCDIMIDQIRAIDNRRLVKRIGKLPGHLVFKVKENIRIVLDV
jgi:mRNA interferase MazF